MERGVDQRVLQIRGVYRRGDSTESTTWSPAGRPRLLIARPPQRERDQTEVGVHYPPVDEIVDIPQWDAGDTPLHPADLVQSGIDDLHLAIYHHGDPEDDHPLITTIEGARSGEMVIPGGTPLPSAGDHHPDARGPLPETCPHDAGWIRTILLPTDDVWTQRGHPLDEGNL